MNRIWQQLAIATNWPILVAAGVLSALGVMSIYADSPVDGAHQLIFLAVAVACMALFQAVDYRTIGRLSWGFYVLSLLLVLYTVAGAFLESHKLPGLPGVKLTKRACNWIRVGTFSLQPAELMKVAFIPVLARSLRFRPNHRSF